MTGSTPDTGTEADAPPSTGIGSGIFGHRDFRLFFIAASISNGGTWMQLIAVQALLFDLTDSGAWLGLSTVASLVPALLLTPYAGVLADRVSRQLILKITQTVQMVTALGLWGMYAGGAITPKWIVTMGFVNGIAAGFQTASWQSFVPLLVPERFMLQAVRLNSVQYTMARAIGPAFGGLIVQFGGVGAAILCNALTYLLVIGTLLLVHPRVNETGARHQKVLEGLRQGAAYIWNRRPLRIAVILSFFVSTFGQSLQYVASAIAERLYGSASNGNAGLLTALGAGALISSGVSIKLGDRLRRSTQTIVALSMFLFGVLLMPLTSSYLVGEIAYFICGAGHVQVAIALNTLIQGTVPDEYRGRAVSLYLLGVLAGIPVGTQLLGLMGDTIGFRSALLVDGAAFAVVLTALLAFGWWRDLDATPEPMDAGIHTGRVGSA